MIEKSKYKEKKENFEKNLNSNGLLEINEMTKKLLDDDSTKILGSLHKNNQDRINKVYFN